MRYGLTRLTGTREPLFTINEAILHSRIDVYDPLQIQRLINAATIRAEDFLGLAFVDQSFRMVLEGFPSMSDIITAVQDGAGMPARFGYSGQHKRWPLRIQFPIGNTKSITSVKYIDTAGVTQTLDPSAYHFAGTMQPQFITPASGSWPATSPTHPNGVTIDFVAGYGASGTATPDTITAAVKMIFGHLYENREDVTPGLGAPSPAVLPRNSDWLLSMHRWR